MSDFRDILGWELDLSSVRSVSPVRGADLLFPYFCVLSCGDVITTIDHDDLDTLREARARLVDALRGKNPTLRVRDFTFAYDSPYLELTCPSCGDFATTPGGSPCSCGRIWTIEVVGTRDKPTGPST